MRRWNFLKICLGVTALAAGSGFPAQAENVSAKYSVRLIGLSLGTAGLTASVDAGQYKIEANARLSGIASMVSNSRGVAVSTGGIIPGKPAPSTYATTSSSSTVTRTVSWA